MTDEIVKQILLVLVSIAGFLGMGAGARRLMSRDARDRAKNETEADWFSTALAETRLDRDNWRRAAEEAWAQIAEINRQLSKLEHDVRNSRQILKVYRRLMAQHPDLAAQLVLQPDDFDDPADTPSDSSKETP